MRGSALAIIKNDGGARRLANQRAKNGIAAPRSRHRHGGEKPSARKSMAVSAMAAG
jgi:hypothetical protein